MESFNKEIYLNLQKKQKELSSLSLTKLFSADTQREQKFHLEQEGLLFDYSKNIIDEEVLQLFAKQSKNSHLKEAISDYFSGIKINKTENSPVLHTALRTKKPIIVDGVNITQQCLQQLAKMKLFSQKISAKSLQGSTGKPIDTLINLGIGGSHLGIQMAAYALQNFKTNNINYLFISNIAELQQSLTKLNPETSLFLVCSKSFTTEETIHNAYLAKNWLQDNIGNNFDLEKHFIAVTAKQEKAIQFGLTQENIFTIGDWVGGRFSLCSSMGLALISIIGDKNFESFLAGFELADEAFANNTYLANIPILQAWLAVWYRNFWHCSNYSIMPYTYELKFLPNYLQQLEMESNGKNVNRQGQKITYDTAPVIFGETGTEAQHSFFQLLHQGSQMVPCDFIGFAKPSNADALVSHQKLLSHFLAQQLALAFGNSTTKNENDELAVFKTIVGNRASSCLLFDELTPKNLGRLIAQYEHKVFVQGILWDIFSFDQWGVEYGKKLATEILPLIQQRNTNKQLDKSQSSKQLLFIHKYNQAKDS